MLQPLLLCFCRYRTPAPGPSSLLHHLHLAKCVVLRGHRVIRGVIPLKRMFRGARRVPDVNDATVAPFQHSPISQSPAGGPCSWNEPVAELRRTMRQGGIPSPLPPDGPHAFFISLQSAGKRSASTREARLSRGFIPGSGSLRSGAVLGQTPPDFSLPSFPAPPG